MITKKYKNIKVGGNSVIPQELFSKAAKIILSNPHNHSETEYKKMSGRKIHLNNRSYIQFEMRSGKKIYHENVAYEKLYDYFHEKITLYRQADLYSDDGGHYMIFNKNGDISLHKAKGGSNVAAVGNTLNNAHNKEKNYIINEGDDIPILVELGVFTKELKVVNQMYSKFKQINRFIELFDNAVSKKYSEGASVNIIDFGCGKSYLTFILYHYLVNVKKLYANVIGVDLKEEVIEKCSSLCDKYGYANLSFAVGDINGYTPPFMPHIVVSLHGCDTATDYALYNALKWNAEIIFAAPCCEHETAGQLDVDSMRNILKYGIVKERFSALLTNSIRCNLLEMQDYKTELIEFVDIAHSPKNLLIRAVKSLHKKAYKDAMRTELADTLQKFGLSPTLYKLLYSNAADFEVRVCVEHGDKEAAFNIREEVFVNEQGFSLEIERDEYDTDALHVIGCMDGVPVACGRLAAIGGKGKLGRIAVLKDKRGNGYGAKICEFLIAQAHGMGIREIYLHSQIGTAGFYRRLGFTESGGVFLEEGAEHIKMVYDIVKYKSAPAGG